MVVSLVLKPEAIHLLIPSLWPQEMSSGTAADPCSDVQKPLQRFGKCGSCAWSPSDPCGDSRENKLHRGSFSKTRKSIVRRTNSCFQKVFKSSYQSTYVKNLRSWWLISQVMNNKGCHLCIQLVRRALGNCVLNKRSWKTMNSLPDQLR